MFIFLNDHVHFKRYDTNLYCTETEVQLERRLEKY